MSLCSVVIGGASPRQVRIQLPRGGASRDLKCGFLFPPDYSVHSSLALEKRLRSLLQELLELATLRASRLYPNFVFNFHNHFPVDSILGNTSSFEIFTKQQLMLKTQDRFFFFARPSVPPSAATEPALALLRCCAGATGGGLLRHRDARAHGGRRGPARFVLPSLVSHALRDSVR